MTKRRLIDYLERLGLCELEVKLYVALLETGPIAVRDLADFVRIKRTRSYMYINSLIDKGLIIKVVTNSHNQVMVNTPDFALEKLVEDKVKSISSIQTDLSAVLHHLHSLSIPEDHSQAEIKYYKGKAGVKRIYEEALRAQELRSYVNIADIEEVFPENFKLFDDAFKKNPKLTMFEIIEESPLAKEKSKVAIQNSRYHYKFFPNGKKITSTDIMIYDGNVSFINLKKAINGVVLRNIDLYNSFITLFDYMWDTLPDTNKLS